MNLGHLAASIVKGVAGSKLVTVVMNNKATALAVAGGICNGLAIAEGIRAGSKMTSKIDERKAELGLSIEEELSSEETVKVVGKTLAPTIILAALGAGCTFGSAVVGYKEIGALKGQLSSAISSAALSGVAYKELSKNVDEECDEQTAKKVKEKTQNKVEEVKKNLPVAQQGAPVSRFGGTSVLFHIPLIDQWFWATKADLQNAAAECNSRLALGSDVTLEDFFDFIPEYTRPKIDKSCLSHFFWNQNEYNYNYNVRNIVDFRLEPMYDPNGWVPYMEIEFVNSPSFE